MGAAKQTNASVAFRTGIIMGEHDATILEHIFRPRIQSASGPEIQALHHTQPLARLQPGGPGAYSAADAFERSDASSSTNRPSQFRTTGKASMRSVRPLPPRYVKTAPMHPGRSLPPRRRQIWRED
jgi:hypothetical protein